MKRPSSLIWVALIIIFLLPTTAARFLVDIAGGLILIILIIPILLGGAGWLGWRYLQSRLKQCEICGTNVLISSEKCPICGSNLSTHKQSNNEVSTSNLNNSIPASSATVDITARDAD